MRAVRDAAVPKAKMAHRGPKASHCYMEFRYHFDTLSFNVKSECNMIFGLPSSLYRIT